jgi:hypothetical protein
MQRSLNAAAVRRQDDYQFKRLGSWYDDMV